MTTVKDKVSTDLQGPYAGLQYDCTRDGAVNIIVQKVAKHLYCFEKPQHNYEAQHTTDLNADN